MLKSFEKNFEKLLEFATKNKFEKLIKKLVNINKKLLSSYIEILAHFNNTTLELSYNKSPTIQKAIPIKASLEEICVKYNKMKS